MTTKPEPLPLRFEFDTYEAAKAYAVHQAAAMNTAFGIERPGADLPEKYRRKMPAHMLKWTVKMLPGKAYRQGFELRCEAVEPPGTW